MRTSAFIMALIQAVFFVVLAGILVCLSLPTMSHAQELSSQSDDEVHVADSIPSEEQVETGTEENKKEAQSKKTLTGDFTVTPVVANEKAKPRDIIKKELLVTNNTAQRMDLYISVENIDPSNGAQEFVSPGASDLSTSLANWIEITRGVIELSPGESRKVPYLIHVNLTAKPGSYFARIQFKKSTERSSTEAGKEGTALMLNVEVYDDAKERLQLGNFMSENSIVFGNTVSFSYLLENVGNRLIEPRGSIRIFNRRGEEVGSIPLNANGEEINPDNKRELASVWSASGRFGKYKAFLDLEYGENQLASVQDTVYFWVFPWKEILASLAGVFVLAIVGTYIVHMRSIAQPVRTGATRTPPHEQFQERHYVPAEQSNQRDRHTTVLRDGNRVPQTRGTVHHDTQIELLPRTKPHVQGNVVQLQKRH